MQIPAGALTLGIASRAVAGAGSAVCFVAGIEVARRGGLGPVALGVFGGVSLAVGGAAVAVIPAAGSLLGWRAAWLTCAVATLFAIVAVLIRRDQPVARAQPRPGAVPRSVLVDRELYRLAAVQAVNFGMAVVLSNWAATILERDWHVSPRTAAMMASLILLSAMVGQPLGGYLNSRHPGRARLVAVSALVTCAVGTALLATPTHLLVAVLASRPSAS
jgi:nitrate/nitrite transporter NarK